MAFHVFLAMELQLQKHLGTQCIPNFKAEVYKAVIEDEDVSLLWSLLSADWGKDDSKALLELLVDMFLPIRGFSYVSAWMENTCTNCQFQDLTKIQRTLEDAFQQYYTPIASHL